MKIGDDNESSQSTDEDVDLEEGEILDSGEEEEEEKEKKDLTNSLLEEALDKNFLKSIEQLVSQAKTEAPSAVAKTASPHNSPMKIKKRSSKYLDHDRFETNSDQEDGWYSPSHKHKSSKYDTKPIDYRKELEAYRGTPPSSPDSKHREKRKKRSSKKSKKSSKKVIKRKDIKGVRVSKYKKELLMKKICKFFKEGKCNKGADCGYSHANPQPFKKKELCKFYLSGHCNKGKECLYMHGEFPCKFYHTGSECYAKDACRFSHSPLTDETKRILADYLNISRGDEDFDRKRRNSPSPEPQGPPAKRTCLLGSPPRHIKEETKRWREEMLLQQQNHPGFKIHISSSSGSSSPPPFTKPNFYQETLLNTPSPKKRRVNPEPSNASLSTGFPPPTSSSVSTFPLPNAVETFSQGSPERYMYEDDYQDIADVDIKQEPSEFWSNMRGMDHNMPPVKTEMEPFVDPAQQDLDFTTDVKFDETTQFSEMESSTDCNLSSPPNQPSQTTVKMESDEENSIHENIKPEDKATDDSSSAQEPAAPPIVIPSHLPKKQQELLKRIVQHQKKTSVAASTSDVSNSPKSFDNSEPPLKEAEPKELKEKCEIEESESSLWYSSEDDDDDDTDEPLTDVLKKLQKEPPSVNPPVKVETKPATSILAMLNKCQQNTSEKKKGVSEQGEFFKNLLMGNIPSSESFQLSSLTTPSSDLKRRTLLPDPQPIVKKEPIVAPKDPRLKNRDPRTLASTVNNTFNLPKTNVVEQSVSPTSSSLTSREIKLSTFSTTINSVITEPSKDDIPYKLHGIYTTPPNYTPYINASQTNPNLLKDPRLRKHMNLGLNNENGVENKKETESIKIPTRNVPPVPKLLLAYNKDSLNINIFESNSITKPVTEETEDIKIPRPKLTDPRMRRRDSQTSSESITPPPLSIIESTFSPLDKTLNAPILENEAKLSDDKIWLPPVSEKSWVPPVTEQNKTPYMKQEIESDEERLEIDESPPCTSIKVEKDDDSLVVTKKVKPIPASHLPRAIADPRMAKLHSPLDSRRPRVANSEPSNKSTVELKKPNSPPEENSIQTSKTSPSDSVVVESENLKTGKNIPKKNQTSHKGGEKKKTVHRNRRSSMDYASPLNSCDDSNSNKSLNYNSYNQRPARTGASVTATDSSVSIKTTNSVISETASDFLSDNSNLECDNNDVNLKDMFKTIDPTASPFC